MQRSVCGLFLLLLTLGSLPAAASSTNTQSSLQPYLATLAQQEPNEWVRVIIQTDAGQTKLVDLLDEVAGRYIRTLDLINAVVAEVPASALPTLAQAPGVHQISLDAPVNKMSEEGDGLVQVHDNFDQVAYSNNDGEGLWAGAWQEMGESDGPNTGNVAITPFWGGALQGLRLQGAEAGAQRPVSLQQAADATLTLAYRRKDFVTETDVATVALSSDGGASWQEVARLNGPATDAEIQYAHLDLAAFVGADLLVQIRLATTADAAAKFYLDAINLQWRPTPGVTVTPAPRVYLPLVAGPEAGAASEDTVQAAVYSTGALSSPYIQAIGADRLWTEAPAYLTGAGVTVAVVDSGITSHPDLRDGNNRSRILASVSFVQDGKSPDDFYGHGTHVAGLIGGNGKSSSGKYMGVAPDANLLDVKVTDDHGVGKMSDVVAGLQWVLTNKNSYNIRIVNLSLNSSVPDSYHTSPLSAAVEILWFNGIVVVVSAGNDGSYKLNSPANDPFVITVGAVDDKGTTTIADDELAKFSAYNITEDGFAKPDLVAPGRNLVALLSADDNNLASDYPSNKLTGSEATYYYKMSGTSMASAVVAGAAALLLQDEPTLTPDQVKQRLLSTVKPFSTTQGCATGTGYLDIYAAVKATTTNSANTGFRASRLLWSGTQPVTWNSVSWNSVSWNSVSWNSVSWNSVSWNSVSWNSVSWNSVSWNSVSWNSVSWNSNSATEAAPQYNCRDVDPTGLLGHWRLDETNGPLVADASGNDNVGTLSSPANRQSNGKRNGTVQLNNGAVNVPWSANLNSMTNQLTISAWVNRTNNPGGWQMITNRQFGTSWDDQFFLTFHENNYRFGVNTVNNGNQWVTGGVNPLNQWVHVAGVYNGSQITLYVNGVAVVSQAMSGNLRTDTRPLLIGAGGNFADPNLTGEYMVGQVDDVRLYKRALSAAEIAPLYNGPSAAMRAPLVIYDDQVRTGWLDWSWNTTRSFNNSAPIYSGSNSIALSYSAAWGGLRLHTETPVSTSGYRALRFQVHGGASGTRKINIRVNNELVLVTRQFQRK